MRVALTNQIPEAAFRVSVPSVAEGFPLYGFSIDFVIQDRGGYGSTALQERADALVEKMNQAGKFLAASAGPRRAPLLQLDIDRTKCMALGVQISEIFETLQVYLGPYYVNNFNQFGRTWQVQVQTDARVRERAADILQLQVKNKENQIVRLGTVLNVRDSVGPMVIERHNMYPAARITANLIDSGFAQGSEAAVRSAGGTGIRRPEVQIDLAGSLKGRIDPADYLGPRLKFQMPSLLEDPFPDKAPSEAERLARRMRVHARSLGGRIFLAPGKVFLVRGNPDRERLLTCLEGLSGAPAPAKSPDPAALGFVAADVSLVTPSGLAGRARSLHQWRKGIEKIRERGRVRARRKLELAEWASEVDHLAARVADLYDLLAVTAAPPSRSPYFLAAHAEVELSSLLSGVAGGRVVPGAVGWLARLAWWLGGAEPARRFLTTVCEGLCYPELDAERGALLRKLAVIANAADANKAVVYATADGGRPVARKLVAITDSLRLIGFRTYTVEGHDEPIREAVEAYCAVWAADSGFALGDTGHPEDLSGGFWYDDGVEAWSAAAQAHWREIRADRPVIGWLADSFDANDREAAWCAAVRSHDATELERFLTESTDSASRASAALWYVSNHPQKAARRLEWLARIVDTQCSELRRRLTARGLFSGPASPAAWITEREAEYAYGAISFLGFEFLDLIPPSRELLTAASRTIAGCTLPVPPDCFFGCLRPSPSTALLSLAELVHMFRALARLAPTTYQIRIGTARDLHFHRDGTGRPVRGFASSTGDNINVALRGTSRRSHLGTAYMAVDVSARRAEGIVVRGGNCATGRGGMRHTVGRMPRGA